MNNIELKNITILKDSDDFISEPTKSLNNLVQRNNNYIIYNNILYKKLYELQNELKELKSMICKISYQQTFSELFPTTAN